MFLRQHLTKPKILGFIFMSKKVENCCEKYSAEDMDFFNELAEKYGLKQNVDQFILERADSERVFMPKSYKILTKNGMMDIEDIIKKEIELL